MSIAYTCSMLGHFALSIFGVAAELKKVVRQWRDGKMTAVEAMRHLGLTPSTFYRKAKLVDLLKR